MMIFRVVLVLAVCRVLIVDSFKSVIAIYDPSESINLQCANGSDLQYTSLDNLSLVHLNDTQIRLCSNNLTLSRVITVANGSNVAIIGFDKPVVTCLNGTLSGFNFLGVHIVKLLSFTMDKCGFIVHIDPEEVNATSRNIGSSLNIQECTDIIMTDVNVTNGQGTGLSLFHNYGPVEITKCTFQGNGQDRTSGGNGIYIETNDIGNTTAEYNISHCRFILNIANTGKDKRIKGFSRFDKGGGMCTNIRGSKGIKLNISNSLFKGNEAVAYGGGMLNTFHGGARYNSIIVVNSSFIQNKGKFGGGAYSGYLHTRIPKLQFPLNCSHIFISSHFMNNSADFGGGNSIFSTKSSIEDEAEVSFKNCTWKYNIGQYGSAIVILPNAWNLYGRGFLPKPQLVNCTIESNYVQNSIFNETGNFTQYSKGGGALYCSSHTLLFRNVTSFVKNNGSALYLDTCLVTFDKYSQISFIKNTGYQGGAIYQLSSILYVSDNCRVYFNSNSAYDKGGGIYQLMFSIHIFDYSKTCFIDYVNDIVDVSARNISVNFTNNEAGTGNSIAGYGHSIYASSLLPCYNRFSFSASNLSVDIFDQVANFSFYPSNRTREIATAVNHSHITEINWSGSIIPGKETVIPYEDYDDLDQNVNTDYRVTIENEAGSSIQTSQAYSLVSNNTLVFLGAVGNQATVTLSSTSRQTTLSFNITVQPCPPGLIQQYDNKNTTFRQCMCSVNTKSEYIGINRCNLTLFQAYKSQGYWIGYKNGLVADEDSLLSGMCPMGFCSHDNYLLLPPTANREELNEIICSHSRTSTLCGQCKAGYTVHYHSPEFQCKPNLYCKWGWLFYILSEIFPVTVIFLVIIFFNIPFTSGIINGFIFYAQVVDVLYITADNIIPFTSEVQTLNRIQSFLYSFFNLNTFALEELSFCLWDNATALDSLAFNYVTLVYSFLLIVLVIFLTNKCNFKCNCLTLNRCIRRQRHTLQGSMIHGLTAFLILCYAQCARISLLLLYAAATRGKGGKTVDTVVFYNGDIKWMGIRHLPYAIPAIVSSLVLVVLPPVILSTYPIHYKILSALKIKETSCVRSIFKPLERLRPILDSFQSCFKDEYRFFSGLYFFYRFLILLNSAISTLQNMYFAVQIQLLIMIIIHTTFQPYKKRLHNIIDTLLFGNIAIINTITMYNFAQVYSNEDVSKVLFTSWIQIVLKVLPLLVVFVSLVAKFPFFGHCYKRSLIKSKDIEEYQDLDYHSFR